MTASNAAATKECPNCKMPAFDLLKIDTGMKLALEAADYTDPIHAAVCSNCYQDLSNMVSQGAKLRAQKIAKDENKKIIWRQRLDIAKKGREEMAGKNYASAAMHYERYLHGLAAGFDVEANQLVPSLFNGQAFKKELLIVSFAYFDLFKIYDNSVKNEEKFNYISNQLKLFSNLPSTRPVIARKLRTYKSTSAHKDAVDDILKSLDKNKSGRCFIATAAFESAYAPEVRTLCAFRDQVLSQSMLGNSFIRLYYRWSPSIANKLDHFPFVKNCVRFALRRVASTLQLIFNLKVHP